MTPVQAGILPTWLDPQHFLAGATPTVTLIMMAILFAECGILIGFFLPGDTMLFVGGLLIYKHALHINIVLMIVLLWVAAFLGNMVGYAIGRRLGPAVFSRPDAKLLKPEYIERSTAFYARWGRLTVILARFVPVVRTIATVMAGASKMPARLYALYSALGGLLWVALVTLAGYFLGTIKFVADNVDVIFVLAVVVVVCVSIVPAVLHLRGRRNQLRRETNS